MENINSVAHVCNLKLKKNIISIKMVLIAWDVLISILLNKVTLSGFQTLSLRKVYTARLVHECVLHF